MIASGQQSTRSSQCDSLDCCHLFLGDWRWGRQRDRAASYSTFCTCCHWIRINLIHLIIIIIRMIISKHVKVAKCCSFKVFKALKLLNRKRRLNVALNFSKIKFLIILETFGWFWKLSIFSRCWTDWRRRRKMYDPVVVVVVVGLLFVKKPTGNETSSVGAMFSRSVVCFTLFWLFVFLSFLFFNGYSSYPLWLVWWIG